MNKIYTSPRGFPFDELTLLELQELSVPVLNAIAKLIPDKSIIYGCGLDSGLNRLDGFILWEGEFLPFKGGANNSQFSIVEETEDRTFNLGTEPDPQLEDHPAYERRWAEIGNIVGAESVHLFSALRRSPKFLTYLVKGTLFVGTITPSFTVDTDTGGTIIEVNFPSLFTPNYMPFSSFYRSGVATQGHFDYDIYDRTPTGFKLKIKNVSEPISNLFYQYLILPSSNEFEPTP